MSSVYVSVELRRRVAEQARRRCGYCLSQEIVLGVSMEIDHLFPRCLGGMTIEDNLWLACSVCNAHKNNRFLIVDPQTGASVRIFNPRWEAWPEHFGWKEQATLIEGKKRRGSRNGSGAPAEPSEPRPGEKNLGHRRLASAAGVAIVQEVIDVAAVVNALRVTIFPKTLTDYRVGVLRWKARQVWTRARSNAGCGASGGGGIKPNFRWCIAPFGRIRPSPTQGSWSSQCPCSLCCPSSWVCGEPTLEFLSFVPKPFHYLALGSWGPDS